MIAGQSPAIGILPAAQCREKISRVRYMTDFRLRKHGLIGGDGDVGSKLIPEAAPQPLTAAMIGFPSRHMCVHCVDRMLLLRCQYSTNSAIDLPRGSVDRVP